MIDLAFSLSYPPTGNGTCLCVALRGLFFFQSPEPKRFPWKDDEGRRLPFYLREAVSDTCVQYAGSPLLILNMIPPEFLERRLTSLNKREELPSPSFESRVASINLLSKIGSLFRRGTLLR